MTPVYRDGEPVEVRVRRREQWVELDDEGRARRAGRLAESSLAVHEALLDSTD